MDNENLENQLEYLKEQNSAVKSGYVDNMYEFSVAYEKYRHVSIDLFDIHEAIQSALK
ncbi:hypothetical protein [Thalassobacillus sp. CUG 92003]|uniref:hypothetical protein n=1 Tax=Thalassobacillus sp. CUG 92003 TaxID=2736641 RepID=UPI0015E7565F|nr:hypothetical protein [Thalassobacillus sp. CUG 92003]